MGNFNTMCTKLENSKFPAIFSDRKKLELRVVRHVHQRIEGANMCCMTSDFANIGHTTFTLVSELHRFLFPRELKQSQKSRSVIRGLKAGNSVLIITPGVPCVIAALEWFWFCTTRICHVFNLRRKMTGD